MEITTTVKLTQDDIVKMIRDKYGVEGEINFIFNDETYSNGWLDGVKQFGTRKVFGGVIIKTTKQK